MSFSLGEYAFVFKALSDETRLRIFSMLSDEEICACKVLEEVSITQPTLSYHMKLLCGSGLVNGRRDGAWMRYSVNNERLTQLQSFLQQIKIPKAKGPADPDCFPAETVADQA